jgi:anti-sigma-K factor RskA
MIADHDEMEKAVAAYVLDACDDDERAMVGAHIEACPSCRELLRRLTQAADALPLAVDEVRPPARLRERILAAAEASARGEEAAPARVIQLRGLPGLAAASRRRRFSWAAAAVAVLAVAVVAGLAFWNVTLQQQVPSHYALHGTGSMAGVKADVAAYRSGVDVVSLAGMPQATAGSVYQVWLIDAAGQALPGPVFTPAADGTAHVAVQRSPGDVRQIAVTSEPGPAGARTPSQKPELAGQIG